MDKITVKAKKSHWKQELSTLSTGLSTENMQKLSKIIVKHTDVFVYRKTWIIGLSRWQNAQKCYFPKSLLFLPERSVFSAIMRLASLFISFSPYAFFSGRTMKIACSKTSLPVFLIMITFLILPLIIEVSSLKLFEDIISFFAIRYTHWKNLKN